MPFPIATVVFVSILVLKKVLVAKANKEGKVPLLLILSVWLVLYVYQSIMSLNQTNAQANTMNSLMGLVSTA